VLLNLLYTLHEYISTLFVRKKKSGKYRTILNFKGLNKHIEKHHFKMDILWSAVRLRTPNCFIASDLLGFVVNVEKSCFMPAQQITFVGFVLDSMSMTITLTDDKKAKVKANCKALLPKTNTTITELTHLVGTLVSCLPGVQFGKLHYRNLEIEKNLALRKHKGNYEAQLTLSTSAKDELTWWIENVDKVFNPISRGNPVIELRTDASKKGWGVYLDGDTTQGLWSVSESQLHINELELKVVHFAVQAFGERLQNKHVKILCDNSTTVIYVNALGGTKSPSCNQIAYDIWDWCVKNNTWLTATHIAGVENTKADKELRLSSDRTEWTLKREIFVQITTHWGTQKLTYLQLDLTHSSPSLSLGNLTQPHVLWMHLQLTGIHCIFMPFHLSLKFTDACKGFWRNKYLRES